MTLGDLDQPVTSHRWEVLAHGINHFAAQRPTPLSRVLLLSPSKAWAQGVESESTRVPDNRRAQQKNHCGFSHDYPASFLWRLTQHWVDNVPATSPFGQQAMAWRWFALFQKPPRRIEQSALMPWLKGQNARAHWQLAESLAQLFQRYRLYADTLLMQWAKDAEAATPNADINDHAGWQKACWLAFLEDLDTDAAGLAANPLLTWVEVLEAGHEHPDYPALHAKIALLPYSQIHVLWGEPLPDLHFRALAALARQHQLVAWRYLPILHAENMGDFQPTLKALYGEAVFHPVTTDTSADADDTLSQLAALQAFWAGAKTANPELPTDGSIRLHLAAEPMTEVSAALQQLLQWLHDNPIEPGELSPRVALVVSEPARYLPYFAAAVAALPAGILRFAWQPSIAPASQLFFQRVMAAISGESLAGAAAAENVAKVFFDATLMQDHDWQAGHRPVLQQWFRQSGWRVGALSDAATLPDVADHGYESARDRWLLGWFAAEAQLTPDDEPASMLAASVDTSLQQGEWLETLITLTESIEQVRIWFQSEHPLHEWLATWQTLMDTLSPTHAGAWQRVAAKLADTHAAGLDIVVSGALWQSLVEAMVDTMNREGEISHPGSGITINVVRTDTDNITPHDYVLILGLSASLYPSQTPRPAFDLLAASQEAAFSALRDQEAHQRQLVLLQWLQAARLGVWLSAPIMADNQAAMSVPAQALTTLETSLALWQINVETTTDAAMPPPASPHQAESLLEPKSTAPLAALWQVSAQHASRHSTRPERWQTVERDTADPVRTMLQYALGKEIFWRDPELASAPLTANNLKKMASEPTTLNALIEGWLAQCHQGCSPEDAVAQTLAQFCKRRVAAGQWPSGRRGEILANHFFKPWLSAFAQALTQSAHALPAWSTLTYQGFQRHINGRHFSCEDWQSLDAGSPALIITHLQPRNEYGKVSPVSARQVWQLYTRMLFHQTDTRQGLWRFELGEAQFYYYPPLPDNTATNALMAVVDFWQSCRTSLQPFVPSLAQSLRPLVAKKRAAAKADEPETTTPEAPLTATQWRKAYPMWQDPFTDPSAVHCWQAGWDENLHQALVDPMPTIETLWQPLVDWWRTGKPTHLPNTAETQEGDDD